MVFCSNCQTEIDDNKMFLHEGFCKKNIKYCFQCKEKVPIEEFEEHLENQHNKKANEEKKTENENINDNKDINIECQYCSLLVDQNELEEHEKMCGSRTVQCDICGQYVQTRLMEHHLNVIHDSGFKVNTDSNIEKQKEIEKRKQIEEDEILARRLAEEYYHYDMNNYYNSFRNF